MTSQLPLTAVQITMGAFDTLYHHELRERLAWRPRQRRELQLHAVRNAIYAELFLILGWLELRGIWAGAGDGRSSGGGGHHTHRFRRGASC